MNLFANLLKSGGSSQPQPNGDAPTVEPQQLDMNYGGESKRATERSGRTAVYAVRVRESFKGEILGLQAEIQLERQKLKVKARKVTEGDLIELMLETLKAARRNGDTDGHAVPIANDIWHGVHEIARHNQCTPAQVIEQLVVQKVAELGLLPRK